MGNQEKDQTNKLKEEYEKFINRETIIFNYFSLASEYAKIIINSLILVNSGALFLLSTVFYQGLKDSLDWVYIKCSISLFIFGILFGLLSSLLAYFNVLYRSSILNARNVIFYLKSKMTVYVDENDFCILKDSERDVIKYQKRINPTFVGSMFSGFISLILFILGSLVILLNTKT